MFRNKLFILWTLASFILLFYSFTQVDLNLTLSKFSIWQVIQHFFQYIGYYMRPQSAMLYVIILFIFFLLYFVTLKAALLKKIDRKTFWSIVVGISAVLFFSYNAFSYDLFNYIFDARIITFFHQNPYQHRPLDFWPDPYLNFMRSTHRTYPYGPVWLLATIPLSFMGSGIFLLTFYLFKALAIGSYIGTIFFLEKILQITKNKQTIFILSFFSFNPLVIFESLVSGHLDIFMIFLAITAFYYMLQKKFTAGVLLFILSVGVKFVTFFLLPVFLFMILIRLLKKESSFYTVTLLSIIFMTIGTIAQSLFGGSKTPEPQPWYLLNIIPFAALLASKKSVVIITCFISLASLLFYIPFIYLGEWPRNIVDIKMWLIIGSFVASFIVYIINFAKKE